MMFQFLKIGAQASTASFWMPPQASTFAAGIDNLFYFIYYLSLLFFVGIVGAMVYFAIKYRRKSEGQKTSDIQGNHTLEIWWSVGPGLLLLVVFFWGVIDWTKILVPPSQALRIRVEGQKWTWAFSYMREGISSKNLTVPVGHPVELTMSSKDVLHSFYVPAFRVKRDVLPNRYSIIWFEPTEIGQYDIYCAEYCGDEHSGMLNKINVVSEADYEKWIQNGGDMGGSGVNPAEFGKQLFEAKGCNACHSIDGTVKVGPTLAKKYGTEEELVDGTKVKIDDNYLRESITVPGIKVVKGFQPVMPSYQGQLTDKQIEALIEYIKSLAQ